jgi:hypothetical protein
MAIILTIVCAILWYFGGQEKSWARDVIIPIIIGLYYAITRHWLLGLLLFGASNIIRMGYGAYDPVNDDKPSFLATLTKDRNGWWIRAIVGAMYGISTMSVMLTLSPAPYNIGKAVAYTAQNSLVSFMVCRFRLNVFWTDLIVGLSFGSILIWF